MDLANVLRLLLAFSSLAITVFAISTTLLKTNLCYYMIKTALPLSHIVHTPSLTFSPLYLPVSILSVRIPNRNCAIYDLSAFPKSIIRYISVSNVTFLLQEGVDIVLTYEH